MLVTLDCCVFFLGHFCSHSFMFLCCVACVIRHSGQNGTGEFIVTLLLMILVTVVFFWKMAKFIHCPDKLERKRRKEVMLKDFLLSQNSTK